MFCFPVLYSKIAVDKPAKNRLVLCQLRDLSLVQWTQRKDGGKI
jgi:hypothetical protein